jgi:hypothetical protein
VAATLLAWTQDGGQGAAKMETAASTTSPARVGWLRASVRRFVSWLPRLLPFLSVSYLTSSLSVNKRSDGRTWGSPPSLARPRLECLMATRSAVLRPPARPWLHYRLRAVKGVVGVQPSRHHGSAPLPSWQVEQQFILSRTRTRSVDFSILRSLSNPGSRYVPSAEPLSPSTIVF